jgi:hypothetical protein
MISVQPIDQHFQKLNAFSGFFAKKKEVWLDTKQKK